MDGQSQCIGASIFVCVIDCGTGGCSAISEVPGVVQSVAGVCGIKGCAAVQRDGLTDNRLSDIADRCNGFAVRGSLTEDSGLVEHPGCQHTG